MLRNPVYQSLQFQTQSYNRLRSKPCLQRHTFLPSAETLKPLQQNSFCLHGFTVQATFLNIYCTPENVYDASTCFTCFQKLKKKVKKKSLIISPLLDAAMHICDILFMFFIFHFLPPSCRWSTSLTAVSIQFRLKMCYYY